MKRYLAVVLGVGACIAAVVTALGPAARERAVYRWPPPELPQSGPVATWYTPLLLASRVPESIQASIPCALPDPRRTSVVLQTARRPTKVGGLRVRVRQGQLLVSVGQSRAAGIAWPPVECPLELSVADGKLTLGDRTFELRSPHPHHMPVVSALISDLNLRTTRGFRVVVDTRTYATSPSNTQLAATGLAVVLALLTLGTALSASPTPSLRAFRKSPRGVVRSLAPYDAGVVGFLVAWTVLAPPTVDDGWVWMRQRIFTDIGSFSNYFETYGASPPLYYWLEWLQHWVTTSSDDILIQRLPTLASLLAAWGLTRVCWRTIGQRTDDRVVLWTMASLFVLIAAAWGMTLRPEPFVSVLVGVSLLGVLSFVSSGRAGPLIAAALAAVLALAAHPEGIAALAPLVAGAPAIGRWLRAEPGRVVGAFAVSTSCTAIGIVLVFLDTDFETWSENRSLFVSFYEGEHPWWLEPARYTDLLAVGWWATPVRVSSVAILLFVVVAYLTTWRWFPRPTIVAIPPASLALALALMTFNPTKSPYHFGSLLVLASVAAAVECAWFLRTASIGSRGRPLLTVSVITIITFVSLSAEGFWGPLDLRTGTWLEATVLGIELLSPRLWLLGGIALCVAVLVIRLRHPGSVAAKRIAAWSIPATASGLVAATAAVITADALRADWALPRQNLSVITGSNDCGLAEVVKLPGGGGEEATSLASRLRERGVLALLEPAPAPFFPCASTPSFTAGVVDVPDLVVGWEFPPWPLQVPGSPFSGVQDLYPVEAIYYDDAMVTVHRIRKDVAGAKLAPAVRVEQ